MGFYNIYKILKDMIRTLFGRKFLKAIILILLITIVLLIVDKKTVSAVSDYPDFTSLVDDYKQAQNRDDVISFIVESNNTTYLYITYNGNVNVNETTPFVFASGANLILSTYKARLYSLSNNTWNYISQASGYNTTNINNTEFLYASANILYMNGDIFFEATDTVKLPEIATSLSDLQTLDFDVLSIDAWDYSTQDLYLLCYDRNSGYMESLETLYPINEILLNQQSKYFMYDLSSDPTINAIYWIPKDEIGFNWIAGGTYAFRFALMDVPHEGGGFRDSYYVYLTDYFLFTLDNSITQTTIDDLNNNTKEKIEQQRHDETINSINNINDFLTDDTVDQNEITDNLDFNNNNEDITNTNSGFFSRLTTMVSDLVDYELSEDETIEIPIPFTTQKIILHSNMLYNTVPQPLQLLFSMFWSYLFGMYLFRFVNKIYIAISTGNILDNFSSSGEVITNDML